jgi:hypothetical protein
VRRRIRLHARVLLSLSLVPACGEAGGTNPDFGDFWSEFSTAVAADDASAIRGLTRFPFLFEGEARDASSFGDVYAALFGAPARSCLAEATPTPDEDRYSAFCGAIVYVFARGEDGWRFAEFTADPEALSAGDAAGVAAFGSWRIAGGRAAPWAPAAAGPLANAELEGTRVEIGADEVLADSPLGCANLEHELVVSPADGIFQGNLPNPAAQSARLVGIERIPAFTMRIACDTGVFDYHQIPGDTLLIGLDNVVWKVVPDLPGSTPAGAVRMLLAEHMTADMGFTPGTVARKKSELSATLADSIAAYFARPQPADEPPPIDGDPFTNTQEYPLSFTFGSVAADDTQATVRVVFADGLRERPVDYVLVRDGSRWVVDDLRYEDGATFRELLRP